MRLSLPADEIAERRAQVERALASVRLEGLEVTEQALSLFDRYVVGEFSLPEVSAAIQALNERQFGSIHVSGD